MCRDQTTSNAMPQMMRPVDNPHQRPMTPYPALKHSAYPSGSPMNQCAARFHNMGTRVSPRPRKDSGRDALHTVEQLKDRADEQERRADVDHRPVRCEGADELPRSKQERQRRTGHEECAEEQGGPARARRCGGIATTHRLSDPHGSSRRDTERHHEGERSED